MSEDNVSQYAAPSRATDLRDLPPTVTYVGNIEVFKDETEEYVKKLKEVGTPVDYKVFEGAFHAFDLLNAKAQISKKANDFFLDSFEYAVDHYIAKQKD